MPNRITGKYIALPLTPLLIGSWLTLVASIIPAYAQIKNNEGVLLTQAVFETLPPPPNSQSQGIEFNQEQQNYQPYQPGQSFQRYFVYVENSSYQTLQTVKRIEPSAYIRRYNGRSVIQAGVFSRQANAQQRVRELEYSGIYGARIGGSGDGDGIPNSPGEGYYGSDRSRYYVTIPAKAEEVPVIANRIRSAVGRYGFVAERSRPLGPHVAVGPFAQRTQAEQWNNYLRNMGFGNARVYYGR
ncbi:hypothetical protein [Anabaena azotica]|uniref:SPOR domain-containing protein n=1 Tax=Anabaena azotica FACHB-119 TaxID=947527 RepID=A0ABR8DDA5_9NOST|nr:hypothetical protein [Anabaena azotica]MBD2503708.1 hypothetical protein [Anabaena azotica FACHB-119]